MAELHHEDTRVLVGNVANLRQVCSSREDKRASSNRDGLNGTLGCLLLETAKCVAQLNKALRSQRVGPGVVFTVVQCDKSECSTSCDKGDIPHVAVRDDFVLGMLQ